MDARLSLILGGVRSGKSDFAEELVRGQHGPTLYVATGLATDPEMERRIRRHRQSRPAHWSTVEEPLDLAGCLEAAQRDREPPAVVLVDSLDFWVSNLMGQREGQPAGGTEALVEASLNRLLQVGRRPAWSLFLVSSEVGFSPVAPYPVGRLFQDLLGLVNRRVAAAADRVYLVVAGLPVELKALAGS